MKIIKNELFNYLIGYIFVVMMVLLSSKTKDIHLVLPEFAVLCVGVLGIKESHWIVSPYKIVIIPSITALMGYCVNLINMGYMLKINLIVMLMLLVLKIAKSRLAPAFATGLLPIITNTNHWYFIIMVISLTGLLMLGVLISGSHKNIEDKIKPIKHNEIRQYLVILLLWSFLVHSIGIDIMIAIPPVLVLLLEVIQKDVYTKGNFIKQVMILTTIAYMSVVSHIMITDNVVYILWMLPLIYIILKIFKITLPAVYAFPPLMLVIPESMDHYIGMYTLLSSVFTLGCVYLIKRLNQDKIKLHIANQINFLKNIVKEGKLLILNK